MAKKSVTPASTLRTQIAELLRRNMLINTELTQQILSASADTMKGILPLLRQMDDLQTNFLREGLRRDPYFVKNIRKKADQKKIQTIRQLDAENRLKEMHKVNLELEKYLLST